VIDLIDAAASRFVLYRVDSVRPGTRYLVRILVAATAEVESAVRALETPDNALKHCSEINRYENDRVCRILIAQLFDEERDPVRIIKWKEIYEVIEIAAFFRGSFQPGPRHQRLTKKHGHHHRRTCL
jgi:uncharacterized protein